ncbi:unnamed protein product [Brachionus calyciflorus]|uniref:Uncharacterized protein n=1 Tax=Brachionus calyciflorus TaxID=104777 RepID=A0A813M856_9BILA|nr:unnamed protein product [Brachionus calyciflorus]
MDKNIILVILLLSTISLIQARNIGHRNYENFCRRFPLHRGCMGAFAGGGKRSFDMVDKSIKENSKTPSLIDDLISYLKNTNSNNSEFKPDKETQNSNLQSQEYSENDYRQNLIKNNLKRKVLLHKILQKISDYDYDYSKR